jgi:hypothetical protein
MRLLVVPSVVLLAIAGGVVPAAADVLYELIARTSDALVRGTVELEERVTVSVKGDRLRQEIQGTRTVVTRRGARYQKPGHRVTLDQLDRGVRYEMNLDAGTYVEESFATTRRQHEDAIVAAEKALGLDPTAALPSLTATVDRPGERLQVQGRECERVVLRSTREIVLAATRGAGPVGTGPSRFSMTFDLCLAPDLPPMQEVRALEERVEHLTAMRGSLAERQLRVFAARRDVLAVFELLQRLMEREQQKLGGIALRWERVLVGPRRDEPEATLFRHWGEITRIEQGRLEASSFDLPPGLTLDPRRASADRPPAQ